MGIEVGKTSFPHTWLRDPKFLSGGPPATRASHLHVADKEKGQTGEFYGVKLEVLLITSEHIPWALTGPHKLPGI